MRIVRGLFKILRQLLGGHRVFLQQQFARVVQEVERIRDQQVASGKEIEGLCAGLLSLTLGAKT